MPWWLTLTRQLVEFIASISFDCLPAAFIEAVKRGAIANIRGLKFFDFGGLVSSSFWV